MAKMVIAKKGPKKGYTQMRKENAEHNAKQRRNMTGNFRTKMAPVKAMKIPGAGARKTVRKVM